MQVAACREFLLLSASFCRASCSRRIHCFCARSAAAVRKKWWRAERARVRGVLPGPSAGISAAGTPLRVWVWPEIAGIRRRRPGDFPGSGHGKMRISRVCLITNNSINDDTTNNKHEHITNNDDNATTTTTTTTTTNNNNNIIIIFIYNILPVRRPRER